MNEEKQPQKTANTRPVYNYIMILFIVAFLLMAYSFLAHQRSNTEVIGELKNSLMSMEGITDLQDTVGQLQDHRDELEETINQLEDQVALLEAEIEAKDSMIAVLEAELAEIARLEALAEEETLVEDY